MVSSLIPLLILGGIVYAVVMAIRSSSDMNATDPIDVGEAAKSTALHVGLFLAFLACAVGLIDLLQYTLDAQERIAGDSSSDLARGLALLIVGLPSFGLLLWAIDGRHNRRRADGDDTPHRGWSIYFSAASATTLIATLVSVAMVVDDLTDSSRHVKNAELVQLAVWLGTWGLHWFVLRPRFRVRGSIHLAIGTVVGLSWMLTGASAAVYRVLSSGYDSAFSGAIEANYRVAFWLIIGVVGAAVWAWYWLVNFNAPGSIEGDHRRSPTWFLTVVAAGVLPGLITMVGASIAAVAGVLIWFFGRTTVDAAEFFEPSPAAATALILAALTWAYHRWEIERGGDPQRNESLRFHDYVVVALALVGVVSGFAALIGLTIETLAVGRPFSGGLAPRNALIIITTILALTAVLWWRYWASIERERAVDPVSEADSMWRKLYLVVGFGAAGLQLAISLVLVLFGFLRDLIEGELGSSTLLDLKNHIGWSIAVVGAVWYHLSVWRQDRKVLEAHQATVAANAPLMPVDPLQSVTIGVASATDFGQLFTLQRAAFVDEAIAYDTAKVPTLTETFDELADRLGRSWTLVARYGDRIVGSVSVRSYRDGGADIERLMVAPDFRRRGLASRLLVEVEAALAGEGHTVVQLIVGEIVHEARALYTRHGYETAFREQAPDGPALLTLRKTIAAGNNTQQ